MISISAGHWGKGTGANGHLDEGVENIKVAKRLTEILKSAKIVTHYIQDTVNKSANANVNWLVSKHNATDRDIDVQVHFNSSAGTYNKGIGIEVLIYDEKYLPIANKICAAVSKVSGLKNRGGKVRKDLGFLRNTKKPAFLIEVCFVNDSVDAAIYRRDFEKISQAIASELATAVGKKLKPSTTSTVDDKPSAAVLNGRKLVRKAVQEGVFDAKIHTDARINSYSAETLLKYALTYIDRTS
ncbi:MAG: N-acetylmuramoyl-L-alanine amidase [Lysinibacillus sp.]